MNTWVVGGPLSSMEAGTSLPNALMVRLPLILLSTLASVVLAVSVAQATPTTFRIQASISAVQDAAQGGVVLPAPLTPGMMIETEWTFDSIPGANRNRHAQNSGVVIRGPGLSLSSPVYDIFVEDDAFAMGLGGPIGPIDSYDVGICTITTAACDLPGMPSLEWSAFLSLSDPTGSALDSSWLEADPTRLNLFSARSLRLSFVSRSGTGATFIEAVVGTVTVVPEPSTALLVLIGLGGISASGRRGRLVRDRSECARRLSRS